MADPTLMDVVRKVESRIRRLRPLDDFEELVEVVLASYRDCLRSWPWGFALQRYRTRLLRPNAVTVELTQGSRSLVVHSSSDPIDWSLWPLLSIPGRRPLYTDGGGNLVDPWIGESDTYQGKLIYSVIPLFDTQVWGLAVTNVGPLAKMSFQMLETLSPNRDKVGRPRAFVPYTPYVEIYPGPDSDYDVDVWITPLPDFKFNPNAEIAAPLLDAVVYKACAHLLAQSNPQLVRYYDEMYQREMTKIRSIDSATFSWPEFHLVYEAGTGRSLSWEIVVPP